MVVVRPAIADDEIARELQAMKDGGIGGVEIQPVYPVALDDAANGCTDGAVPLATVSRSTALCRRSARARSACASI